MLRWGHIHCLEETKLLGRGLDQALDHPCLGVDLQGPLDGELLEGSFGSSGNTRFAKTTPDQPLDLQSHHTDEDVGSDATVHPVIHRTYIQRALLSVRKQRSISWSSLY